MAGPQGQRQPVRRDEQQGEDVAQAHHGDADAIPGQPAPPPAGVRRHGPHQQVARDRGQRRHQRVAPRVLGVPGHAGQHREHQARRQPGPGGDQAAPQRGEETGGYRHSDRGREPERQHARPGRPGLEPHEHVVGAVHDVGVAEHAQQLRQAPVHGGQRRALVPPQRRALDLVERDRQRDQRRDQRHPGRPARQPRAPRSRGRRIRPVDRHRIASRCRHECPYSARAGRGPRGGTAAVRARQRSPRFVTNATAAQPPRTARSDSRSDPMVASTADGSYPQCAMQFAHRGSLPRP